MTRYPFKSPHHTLNHNHSRGGNSRREPRLSKLPKVHKGSRGSFVLPLVAVQDYRRRFISFWWGKRKKGTQLGRRRSWVFDKAEKLQNVTPPPSRRSLDDFGASLESGAASGAKAALERNSAQERISCPIPKPSLDGATCPRLEGIVLRRHLPLKILFLFIYVSLCLGGPVDDDPARRLFWINSPMERCDEVIATYFRAGPNIPVFSLFIVSFGDNGEMAAPCEIVCLVPAPRPGLMRWNKL